MEPSVRRVPGGSTDNGKAPGSREPVRSVQASAVDDCGGQLQTQTVGLELRHPVSSLAARHNSFPLQLSFSGLGLRPGRLTFHVPSVPLHDFALERPRAHVRSSAPGRPSWRLGERSAVRPRPAQLRTPNGRRCRSCQPEPTKSEGSQGSQGGLATPEAQANPFLQSLLLASDASRTEVNHHLVAVDLKRARLCLLVQFYAAKLLLQVCAQHPEHPCLSCPWILLVLKRLCGRRASGQLNGGERNGVCHHVGHRRSVPSDAEDLLVDAHPNAIAD
mmetsp:Transcript_91792/g.213465  ORF Transcript_91792/g.213465 Transcript_91792/m.213465 type:complete len:275 (+) Transcript_91792:123-947(+)